MSTTTRDTSAFNARRTALGTVDWIAIVLMIIGSLNWGVIGLGGPDLVALVFGQMTPASRAIYILVGIAGLYGISMPFRLHRVP
jgi:uncharacterized membrane protein YuzA (DUF378 family)